MDNDKRIETIKKILGCRTDNQLASKINSHQPNISRWKKSGFSTATANLIDKLILVIEEQKAVIEDEFLIQQKLDKELNKYVSSITGLDKRVESLEQNSRSFAKISKEINERLGFIEAHLRR